MSTFVAVGNAKQPFRRLLDCVGSAVSILPQPVIVQRGYTPFTGSGCQVVEFMEMDEFDRNVRDADLVILHAGAGSVIHAVSAGKVPVIMARRAVNGEHVNDHQVEFAQALSKLGKVIVVNDPDDIEGAAREALVRQEGINLKHSEASEEIPEIRMATLVHQALINYASLLDRRIR